MNILFLSYKDVQFSYAALVNIIFYIRFYSSHLFFD